MEDKFALAVESGKKRDYKKAAKILGELISETDPPPEAWLLLGRSFHAMGQYSQALAAFNDYVKIKPASSEGRLFSGRSYLALGLPYKAVPHLRKALEINPADPQAMALLGTAYLRSKHSQAAVALLEGAVGILPNDRRIYRAYLNALLVRGLKLCRTGEYELAIQILKFVLENKQETVKSPLLCLELGKACKETGRFEESLKYYTQALKLAPQDRRIRWLRVSVLLALGRSKEVRAEIDKLRSGEPGIGEFPWDNELVDLFVIRSNLEAGEWRSTVEGCRAWLKNRGKLPVIHAYFAEALRNLKEYKTAHNHLMRAREKDPAKKEFWYADILVCWESGDYAALKKTLSGARRRGIDPNLIRRFSVLLDAKTSSDDKKNLGSLQEAIRALGPDPELMYELAQANLRLGLLEQARSWFSKTLILKGEYEEARLGEIAALEALGAEAPEGALGQAYDAYLERWPDNFPVRRERALYLVRTCDYAKAASELEKLLVWEPSNPSLRRILAYSYRKTGRYREACVFLKALLREKPGDVKLLLEYVGCLKRVGAGQYAATLLEKASEYFKDKQKVRDLIREARKTG